MRLPNPVPSPILGGARWSMASAANVAHFEHGAKVAYETPLPGSVTEAIASSHANHVGQLVDLFTTIFLKLLFLVGEAMVHYPLGAIAVLWWMWETYHLGKTLLESIRAARERRRKRSRVASHAAPRRIPRGTTRRGAPPPGRSVRGATRRAAAQSRRPRGRSGGRRKA